MLRDTGIEADSPQEVRGAGGANAACVLIIAGRHRHLDFADGRHPCHHTRIGGAVPDTVRADRGGRLRKRRPARTPVTAPPRCPSVAPPAPRTAPPKSRPNADSTATTAKQTNAGNNNSKPSRPPTTHHPSKGSLERLDGHWNASADASIQSDNHDSGGSSSSSPGISQS